MDLTGDDGIAQRVQKASQLSWDRKKKKFVKGDGAGSDNKKLITTESGARMPASYRSGRFQDWKKTNRIVFPKLGETEPASTFKRSTTSQYRHTAMAEAKPLDPLSTTYERKLRKRQAAKAANPDAAEGNSSAQSVSARKRELRSTDDIRKARRIAEQVSLYNLAYVVGLMWQRRAKNARPRKKNSMSRA